MKLLALLPDSPIPGITILVCLAGAVASLLTCSGCAGLEIVTHSPYGDATYQIGILTATPAPNKEIPLHFGK